MTNSFHTIKFTGNLIFESKYQNFRVALSEYLSKVDEAGVQLRITNVDHPEEEPEDVVVTMSLVRFKQHPQDHLFAQQRQTLRQSDKSNKKINH